MNPYPPEWDIVEEEQPIVEAEYEPPQPVPAPRPSRQAPPPRARQQRPGRQGGNGLSPWVEAVYQTQDRPHTAK